MDESKGLVIADFSSKNFERLEMFAQIARESGRVLVVTSRDIYMLNAIEYTDGVCRTKGLFVYEEVSDNKSHCEMDRIEEKYSGRTISPQQISQDPGRYILCFSFYDMKHLLDIAPESCSYIYSSSEAYSEDQEIDPFKTIQLAKIF